MVTVPDAARGGNGQQSHGARPILDAVVRVLVRDGLDGLSVRRVAAEAGVSIGAVQHHFATKDALLVAAADHVTTRFRMRAEELTRHAHAEGGPMAAFLAFCQLLANAEHPTEGVDDTDASVVWLWYAAKATRPGPVARAFTAGWSQTEAYLQARIAELYPHRDATQEAGHLLAVLDGLAVARAAEPDRMVATRARSIVRRHLAQLAAEAGDTSPFS